MGNASEMNLLVSSISKENDFLMATIYTIFGKSYLPFFLQHMYVYQLTEMNDYTDNSTNECTPCLLNPLLLFLLLLLHQVCCL